MNVKRGSLDFDFSDGFYFNFFFTFVLRTPHTLQLKTELGNARMKRKDEQKENRVEFDDALVQQHDVVRDEEGPMMKDEMMNERREWFTRELAQGTFFFFFFSFFSQCTSFIEVFFFGWDSDFQFPFVNCYILIFFAYFFYPISLIQNRC